MQLDGGRFDRMLQSANALGLVVVRGEVVGNGWTSVGALRPLAVTFVGAAGAVMALREGALAGWTCASCCGVVSVSMRCTSAAAWGRGCWKRCVRA